MCKIIRKQSNIEIKQKAFQDVIQRKTHKIVCVFVFMRRMILVCTLAWRMEHEQKHIESLQLKMHFDFAPILMGFHFKTDYINESRVRGIANKNDALLWCT